MGPTRRVLPFWLSLALAFAIVFSGVAVTTFGFLSLDAYMRRPINPLAEAAEAVIDVELNPLPQDGQVSLPTVVPGEATPTLIPTSEAAAVDDRVNVLVMGIDRRPGEAFISRTDSMMLMSIDPDDETAAILSIPRDLYVVLPGRGRDRINTAFVYGSGRDNPAAGAQYAMHTVSYNLGVPVDHYLLVDFGAVIRGIDALGGIDVYVPYNIADPTFPDMNYGFDPLYIPAGQHHFDGETALKYARTRHQDNDFNRAERQQQVLLAVRNRVLNLGFAETLRRAPTLWQQVNNGIRTDLSFEDLIRLATAASSIDGENIRNEVLDEQFVTAYRTEQGASVLVPINERIGTLVQDMFYD